MEDTINVFNKKQDKKNDRFSPNTNNNNHNRFAIFAEDDDEEEESSKVSVSTSFVSHMINNRNKRKSIKNTKVRCEEEDEKENDWEEKWLVQQQQSTRFKSQRTTPKCHECTQGSKGERA